MSTIRSHGQRLTCTACNQQLGNLGLTILHLLHSLVYLLKLANQFFKQTGIDHAATEPKRSEVAVPDTVRFGLEPRFTHACSMRSVYCVVSMVP
jgi:hypothetical protein